MITALEAERQRMKRPHPVPHPQPRRHHRLHRRGAEHQDHCHCERRQTPEGIPETARNQLAAILRRDADGLIAITTTD
jgi:hypothetical protein